MAFLKVLKGTNPGQEFALDLPQIRLGRHPNCQIVLNAGAVSREHAEIERVEGDFFVRDLDSRNGTFVNGELVAQGTKRRLQDQDRLKICDLLFTFHLNAKIKAPPPTVVVNDPNPSGVPASSSGQDELSDDPRSGSSNVVASVGLTGRSSSDSNLVASVAPEVKLRALHDIAQGLRKAVKLDDTLQKTLDTLFTLFPQADRGFVVFREGRGSPLLVKAEKHRRPDRSDHTRPSRTIVNSVLESQQALLTADAGNDSRFDPSQSIADFQIRSAICAPLIDSEGNALGAIHLDTNDNRHRFSEDDLVVLATAALQVAIMVENAQLHEQALRQQQTAHELQLARQVQQGFLPHSRPALSGYEFFDYYEPAKQVGGDYYDYVLLGGGRLATIVADVSGKGVPAALLMAKVSSEMRYCLAMSSSVAESVRRLNDSFCQGEWEDRFVTLAVAVVDPGSHEVTLVNAGHMDPLLRRRDGKVMGVGEDIGGLPIGVREGFEYEQCTVELAEGDCLTLFSDGISEAMNMSRDVYGIPRLKQQLAAARGTVVERGRFVLDDVKRFAGQQTQSDDMCLVTFGRRD